MTTPRDDAAVGALRAATRRTRRSRAVSHGRAVCSNGRNLLPSHRRLDVQSMAIWTFGSFASEHVISVTIAFTWSLIYVGDNLHSLLLFFFPSCPCYTLSYFISQTAWAAFRALGWIECLADLIFISRGYPLLIVDLPLAVILVLFSVLFLAILFAMLFAMQMLPFLDILVISTCGLADARPVNRDDEPYDSRGCNFEHLTLKFCWNGRWTEYPMHPSLILGSTTTAACLTVYIHHNYSLRIHDPSRPSSKPCIHRTSTQTH